MEDDDDFVDEHDDDELAKARIDDAAEDRLLIEEAKRLKAAFDDLRVRQLDRSSRRGRRRIGKGRPPHGEEICSAIFHLRLPPTVAAWLVGLSASRGVPPQEVIRQFLSSLHARAGEARPEIVTTNLVLLETELASRIEAHERLARSAITDGEGRFEEGAATGLREAFEAWKALIA